MVAELAQRVDAVVLGDELAGGVLEQLLLFGEDEGGGFGGHAWAPVLEVREGEVGSRVMGEGGIG